jgi:hypothetical protein
LKTKNRKLSKNLKAYLKELQKDNSSIHHNKMISMMIIEIEIEGYSPEVVGLTDVQTKEVTRIIDQAGSVDVDIIDFIQIIN